MDDDLCAIFARVPVACSCPGSVPCVFVCVEVWHILFVLISLYSVFNVQDVILDLVYY